MGVWHSAESFAQDPGSSCFAAACDSTTWCVENNVAEGADNYLDPIKSLVAAMKFVPFSHMLTDTVIPSAYAHFWHGMPLVKLLVITTACSDATATVCPADSSTPNTFAQHPILLYMHTSQNDEMSLYAMHLEFIAVLLGSYSMPNNHQYIHGDTKFVADFDDCDYHFFSEADLWDVIGWFSDVPFDWVMTPAQLVGGATPKEVQWKGDKLKNHEAWLAAYNQNVHGVALCFVY